MNANAAQKAWSNLCPPAQIYPIVMTAVVLFNLYRGTFRRAISHFVALLIGTTFLWVLCAADLEVVAYGMLIMPLIFFAFLLAVIFYDQSLLTISRAYKLPDCDCCDEPNTFCDCC